MKFIVGCTIVAFAVQLALMSALQAGLALMAFESGFALGAATVVMVFFAELAMTVLLVSWLAFMSHNYVRDSVVRELRERADDAERRADGDQVQQVR